MNLIGVFEEDKNDFLVFRGVINFFVEFSIILEIFWHKLGAPDRPTRKVFMKRI